MITAPITSLGRADPARAANLPKPQAPADTTAQDVSANAQALANTGEKVVISSSPETNAAVTQAPIGGKAQEQSFEEAIAQRIKELNVQMEQRSTKVQFSIDEESKNLIVRVLNKETGEVIRQIPSEEVLNLTKTLKDFRGLMLSSVS